MSGPAMRGPGDGSGLGDASGGAVPAAGPHSCLSAVVSLGARIIDAPVAVIFLVDGGRFGVEAATPGHGDLELDAFCAEAMRCPGRMLALNDAAADPRFATCGAIAGPPFLRLCIAVPLCSGGGQGLGVLCVADTVPRQLSDGQADMLRDLARCAEGLLDLHRSAAGLRESEARRLQAMARYLINHDALTGLSNRAGINRALAEQTGPGGHPFAVFKIDLDNLRGVNTTHGMAAGDALVREAARRLTGCLREGDVLGRSGGDEFILLAKAMDRREEAGMLAARIEIMFQSPALLVDQPVAIGVSIGIAFWPRDGADADTLLPNAALALARAKEEGRATFRFFRAQTDETARTRQALMLDLAEALPRGELALAFQPQFNLRSGRLEGFEALLRWHHPARGSIPPAEFIPLAESSGLIVPLGRWALEQACRAAAQWPASVSVAVNLSPKQFGGARDLVWMVAMALAEAGLAANRLELEITESVPLLDDSDNMETLGQLRALGARIVLDDFGSGYSSLAYLQSFAFDKLKIDRSIVTRLTEADTSRAILRAIMGLARSLAMRVTAEGVESAAQAACLRAEGCDRVQGFFFSTPIAAEDVPGVIADGAE